MFNSWNWADWMMVGVVIVLMITVFLLKKYTDRQHIKAEKELDEALRKYESENPEVVKNPMYQFLKQGKNRS